MHSIYSFHPEATDIIVGVVNHTDSQKDSLTKHWSVEFKSSQREAVMAARLLKQLQSANLGSWNLDNY